LPRSSVFGLTLYVNKQYAHYKQAFALIRWHTFIKRPNFRNVFE